MKIRITENQKLLLEALSIKEAPNTVGPIYKWDSLFRKAQTAGLIDCYVDTLKLIEIKTKDKLPTNKEVYFLPPNTVENWNPLDEAILEKTHLYDQYIHSLSYELTKKFIDENKSDYESSKKSKDTY